MKDSVLVNFPLYCPKCKQEMLMQAKDSKIVLTKEDRCLQMPHGVYGAWIAFVDSMV